VGECKDWASKSFLFESYSFMLYSCKSKKMMPSFMVNYNFFEKSLTCRREATIWNWIMYSQYGAHNGALAHRLEAWISPRCRKAMNMPVRPSSFTKF
jgi:hypothetical protein